MRLGDEMRLTERMVSMLETALEYDNPPRSVGCFPDGPGQWSTVRALIRRGLLESVGTGRDVNGEHEDDVWIFRLTSAGRGVLEMRK